MGNHMTRATLLCHQPPGSSLAVTCSLCIYRVKDNVGCLKRPMGAKASTQRIGWA